jgi:enoyl-CoA hydratase/3-hydroxyacyl-CoA dehydrogenase
MSQVVLDVMKYGQRIKKTCVVVGNCTGFCVNRVFAPYTQAACILLDAGMDPYLIDKAIAGFGMPMGPFRCRQLVLPCRDDVVQWCMTCKDITLAI